MAQETQCSALISACLHLISTDVPRLLKLRLNAEQLKEVLRMPSIKDIGGERQLRLVASWMNTKHANVSKMNPVDQLDGFLPLVDLQSITEAQFSNFICENHVIVTNQVCR